MRITLTLKGRATAVRRVYVTLKLMLYLRKKGRRVRGGAMKQARTGVTKPAQERTMMLRYLTAITLLTTASSVTPERKAVS
jgi:hypothetical protein